jgi:hypothetical protein
LSEPFAGYFVYRLAITERGINNIFIQNLWVIT